MKKLFLILLVVAFVGAYASAEVTGVDAPSVSGSVTATFGYDLDNTGLGFENDTAVDIVVPLAGGSDTGAGMGDVYAEITVEDIEISLSTDDEDVTYDASVSAKVVAGPIWVGLNNPDFSFNNVDLDADPQADNDEDDVSFDVNADPAGTGGISVGYMSDAFSFAVLLASKNSYDEADAVLADPEDDSTSWYDSNETDAIDADDAVVPNTAPDFVFGANATIVAGPATIPIFFAYDATYGADALMGFGAAPSIVAGDLTLDIPFDYVSVGAENGMELMPTVSYAIADVGTIAVDFFYAAYDIPSVVGPVSDIMEVGLTFTEAFNDALSMVVAFDLTDLAETEIGWNVNLDLGYDLGVAAPYVVLDYGSNADMDLSVGATLAVIDNATVTVDYTNGHVLVDPDDATDEAAKGLITFAVEVAY